MGEGQAHLGLRLTLVFTLRSDPFAGGIIGYESRES